MTQSNNTDASAKICAEEYTVKRGDSFYLISHKLGVPLRDLLAANRDIHPARLMVGDVLCIPREEDDSAGVTDPSQRPADDMTTGEEQRPVGDGSTGGQTGGGTTGGTTGGGSTPSCPVEDQYIVQRGQTVSDIQLRASLSRHTLDVANTGIDLENLRVGQTICVPQENTPCAVPSTYTLGQTETLEAVAMLFSLPIASILRANPCLAPQDFTPGTTVIIPKELRRFIQQTLDKAFGVQLRGLRAHQRLRLRLRRVAHQRHELADLQAQRVLHVLIAARLADQVIA